MKPKNEKEVSKLDRERDREKKKREKEKQTNEMKWICHGWINEWMTDAWIEWMNRRINEKQNTSWKANTRMNPAQNGQEENGMEWVLRWTSWYVFWAWLKLELNCIHKYYDGRIWNMERKKHDEPGHAWIRLRIFWGYLDWMDLISLIWS